MGHLFRRVGTGLWVVMATMGVTVVALVSLARADARQAPGGGLTMAVAEFQPLHAHKRVLVVDVRDAGSFMNGHIPGALHVPVHDIHDRLRAVKKASKGRVIITYCSCPTEASSLRAAKLLSNAGLSARALVGGFPKWVESGGAIERGSSVVRTVPLQGRQGLGLVSSKKQRSFGGQERSILGL